MWAYFTYLALPCIKAFIRQAWCLYQALIWVVCSVLLLFSAKNAKKLKYNPYAWEKQPKNTEWKNLRKAG
jgi:hypothetical protein